MIDKEEILKEYLKWVEQVSEDLEGKTVFSVQEIVYKVVELVESKFEEKLAK